MREGGSITAAETRDEDRLQDAKTLGRIYALLGGAYPLWWLMRPAGALDPLWAWCAIGLAFFATGTALLRLRPSPIASYWHVPAFLSGAHLNLLFALNPSEPFYATAGVLTVFASLLVIQTGAGQLAYGAMVLALATTQLVYGARNATFFAGGVVWMLALAQRYVRTQLKARKRVTSALEAANSELERERSARQRLESELLTAQRMDSLGRLAGAFSHEFNNQLMAIRIHADLVGRSLPADASQRRDIAQIQQTTSSAADLTARLLAFSRPNRTREEPADLCAVLRQNVLTLRHLMSERSSVGIQAPAGPVHAPVGAKQLGQILLNLALNARDAMPNGGSLGIEVARIPRASVELPIDIPGETLARLTVSDSGAGMSRDVCDRLFEPFFTTKAEGGNSGLGLSVVYGLVKETGGHIRVTSAPGAGARFDIFWPIVAAHAGARAGDAPARPAPRRARVLLVEDQAALRDGLSRWLGDQGYAVVACESGEEALMRASEIDVIASDVVLRGMDGIQLLGRLRRAAPTLPAVLFSGHLDHLSTSRREIPEGVMFLEKPFAPEALATTLDSLVARARAASAALLN